MTGNRKRAPLPERPCVRFVCTCGGGRSRRPVSPDLEIDSGALREVSGRRRSHATLRQAFAEKAAQRPISAVDLHCSRCGRGPQVGPALLAEIVADLLRNRGGRRRVIADISDPAVARLM